MVECDCGEDMEEVFPNQFECPTCGKKKLRMFDYDGEGNILSEEFVDDEDETLEEEDEGELG